MQLKPVATSLVEAQQFEPIRRSTGIGQGGAGEGPVNQGFGFDLSGDVKGDSPQDLLGKEAVGDQGYQGANSMMAVQEQAAALSVAGAEQGKMALIVEQGH